MARGGATRSFQAVLGEIYDIHGQELFKQREHYEQRLREVYQENVHIRNLLAQAQKEIESLHPPKASRTGPESTPESDQSDAEAGRAAEGGAGPEPLPDKGAGSDAGTQRKAVHPAALVTGAAEAAPEGAAPAAADPEHAPRPGPRWLWEIVGGEDKGGIVVREREQIDSRRLSDRLATGSLVEETERNGDRLRFRQVTGAGPKTGWISIKVSGGILAVLADRPPLRPWQPPPEAVGPDGEPPLPTVLAFTEADLPTNILGMYRESPSVKEGLIAMRQILSIETFMYSGHEAQALHMSLVKFIASLAALEKLKDQSPSVVTRAGALAGIGVGQYAALCAAGVLSLEDGLNLAKIRATAQVVASVGRRQRTIQVSAITQHQTHVICREARKKEGTGGICQISGYFSHNHVWVSGGEKAVDLVETMVREAGGQVQRLFDSAPHTPMMALGQAELTAALEEALPRMKPPLYSVWLNSTAEPIRPGCDPASFVDHLKCELVGPMLWAQSCAAMRREGLNEFYHVQLMTEWQEPILQSPPKAASWPGVRPAEPV